MKFPLLVSMKSLRHLLSLGAQRLRILAESSSPLSFTFPGRVTNISPISDTIIGAGTSILWTGLPGMSRPVPLGRDRPSPGLRSAGGRGETEQAPGAARTYVQKLQFNINTQLHSAAGRAPAALQPCEAAEPLALPWPRFSRLGPSPGHRLLPLGNPQRCLEPAGAASFPRAPAPSGPAAPSAEPLRAGLSQGKEAAPLSARPASRPRWAGRGAPGEGGWRVTGAAAAKGEGKGGRRCRGFLAVSGSLSGAIPKRLAISPGAVERDRTWGYSKSRAAEDGVRAAAHAAAHPWPVQKQEGRRAEDRKAVCTFD